MIKWIKNNNGVFIPNREGGFIQPSIGLMNKKRSSGGTNYFSPLKKGNDIVLSSNNSVATATVAGWESVLSITSHNSGKFYSECMSNATIAGGYIIFGVATSSFTYGNSYPGNDSNSWGTQFTNTSGARTYHSAANVAYASFANQVGGSGRIAVDFSSGGIWLGDSASGGRWYVGNPATGTSPSYTFTPGISLSLALGVYSNAMGVLHNNPGENLLIVPTGFSMWN